MASAWACIGCVTITQKRDILHEKHRQRQDCKMYEIDSIHKNASEQLTLRSVLLFVHGLHPSMLTLSAYERIFLAIAPEFVLQ
jgi:uncharacterized membrane protein YiaA